MKKIAAEVFALSIVLSPLPSPHASMFDRKPSGKDRSKIKASRKQSRQTRRKLK
jgi:hypothetical protein